MPPSPALAHMSVQAISIKSLCRRRSAVQPVPGAACAPPLLQPRLALTCGDRLAPLPQHVRAAFHCACFSSIMKLSAVLVLLAAAALLARGPVPSSAARPSRALSQLSPTLQKLMDSTVLRPFVSKVSSAHLSHRVTA